MESREEVQAQLERAASSLDAAQALLGQGFADIAASRAYYAAFYAATALHLAEGRTYRKHSGVLAAVHQHFVKEDRLDTQSGKNLNWLFELRSVGDYGGSVHVPRDEAEDAIAVAQRFLSKVQSLINEGA